MAHEKCATCKRSSKADGWAVCANCLHNNSRKDRYEPLTNADRIRNMTDEELATLISGGDHICDRIPEWVCKGAKCFDCCLAWLRSPMSPVEESEK